MAKTYEQCEAEVEAAHPEFRVQAGEEVTVITPESDPATYDAMVAERAQWCVEESERKEEHQADAAEKAGIVEKGQWLEETADKLEDTSQSMTSQQIRNVLAETQRILADVIRYLNKQSKQPVEEGP